MNTLTLSSLKQPDTFNQILSVLRSRFGQLPDHGVLAGQSVASALFTLVGFGDAPMKDLDLFIKVDRGAQPENHGFAYRDRPLRATKNRVVQIIDSCSYGDELFFKTYTNSGYELVFSYTDSANPDWNIVGFHHAHKDDTPDAYRVIEGFDLNLCQIALDLDSKTVHYTPAFEDFLFQQQIRVVTLSTPVHTAFRLLKKLDEMPQFYAILEHELLLLQRARAIAKPLERHSDTRDSYLRGQLLSETSMNKYSRFMSVLAPYFDLRRLVIDTEHDHSDIVPQEGKFTIRHNFNRVRESSLYTIDDIIAMNMSKDQQLISAMAEKDGFDLSVQKHFYTLDPKPLPAEFKQEAEQIIALHMVRFLDGSAEARYAVASDLLLEKQENAYPRRSDLDKQRAILNALNRLEQRFENANTPRGRYELDESYVVTYLREILLRSPQHARHLNTRDLMRIIRMATNHPSLLNYVAVSRGVNLAERLVITARHCNYLDKHDLRFVIGLYETRSDAIEQFGFKPMFSPDFMSNLADCVTRFKAYAQHQTFDPISNHVDLIQQIETAGKPFGVQARALCQQWEFLLQGSQERHCVGGYYDRASKHERLVIALRDRNGETATADYFVSIFAKHEDEPVEAMSLMLKRVQLRTTFNQNAAEHFYSACPSEVKYPYASLPKHIQALFTVSGEGKLDRENLFDDEIPF